MGQSHRSRRPASSDEAREAQLAAMAYDLVEKQILEGTASSQTISHFLKAGSGREKLERERLQKENQLLVAKVEELQEKKKVGELLERALDAMKLYTGQTTEDDYDD